MNNTKLLTFKLKKNLWGDIFWAYKTAFHGSWMEFAEHREYIPWDEIKHIDWKVSAKTNKLYIKKYEEERNLNVLFILDLNLSFSQFIHKQELLKETFFLLALSAINNNDNISVLINNQFIRGLNSKQIFIKTLAELDKDHSNNTLLSNLEKIKKIKNHLIFILSDETNTQILPYLKKLQLQNDIIFINIFDSFENKLSRLNSDLNLSNSKLLACVNLNSQDKIKKYQLLREKKINKFKQKLIQSNISYLYLDTEKNIYKELYKFFMSQI